MLFVFVAAGLYLVERLFHTPVPAWALQEAIGSVVVQNLWLAGIGIVGSSVQVLAAIRLGSLAVRPVGATMPARWVLAGAIGAAVYANLFSVLAVIGCAYGPLLVFLTLLVFAIPYRDRSAPERKSSLGLVPWVLIAASIPFVVYVLLNCITNPTGPDLAIYHLGFPFETLRHHRFIDNPFSFASGVQLGWHMFGLPAFYLGGDRAFVCLSFWAFLGLLCLVYDSLSSASTPTRGALAVLSTAAIVCGFSRASVSNNDIALSFIEFTCLYLVLGMRDDASPRCYSALGVLFGFALSIKALALASALPLACLLFWNSRVSRRWLLLGWGVPLAVLWPLITCLNSGVLAPKFVVAPPGSMPHYPEAQQFMAEYFGYWYQINFRRFFCQDMAFFSWLIGGIAMVVFFSSARSGCNALLRSLLFFATARFAAIVALGRSTDYSYVYHDRYHILSYLCLGIVGVSGWYWYSRLLPRSIARTTGALVVVFWVSTQLFTTSVLLTPSTPHFRVETNVIPSMVGELRFLARDFTRVPGTQGGGDLYWIDRRLPAEAVIAGNRIAPYSCKRTYLQILPEAENLLDLRLSLREIVAELRNRGATHLHLNRCSGLPQWTNHNMNYWLRTIGRIPFQPGAKVVYLRQVGGRAVEIVCELPEPASCRDLGPSFFPKTRKIAPQNGRVAGAR
ncbi:hypothetical protein AYO40_02875 [Planctomycetaceae bacterium SCGC AG-212-D15]|nr:hypothetical protein AYO40_02875 [Planctomycetaceae bacterium SCGC AG-212-D15]